ncbi:hypothetical protein ACJ41O_013142 [Fusarium nematophilum]
MKAEFQLEFTKLSDRMAQEVTRTTAQMAQELFLVREQLTEARSELEQTRLQLDIMNSAHAVRSSSQTYADAARMTPVSITTQAPSTVRSASPEPVFCTVDTSRVPEDHIGDTTPAVLRRTIEQEMRTSSDQPSWRCVAVTRDGRNTNRLRVIGRNEEELNRIKAIIEAKKAPGARVLRDQLYPVKVDNINRTAVLDHEGKVLPGAMEALGQENEVQIAKMAWLSRKDSVKAYGSMVVYLTKNSDARRLLQERYFHAVGESAYTSVFERRTGPVQCYNCQELGHKAFSCNRNRGVPTGGTVQQQTDRLMSVVLEAIHALTPRAKPSPYAKRWWTTDLTQLRQIYTYWRNRARAERRAGRILPDLEQGAKNAAKQYHDAIRQQKNAHWSEFLANEANIWKVGKYLNPDDSAAFGKVPQLARADGSCTNDSSEQAEELMATFFPPLPTTIADEGTRGRRPPVPTPDITLEEVERQLFVAKPWKAPGEDGLPAMVWRQTWPVIKHRVLALFRTSLQEGELPTQWRHAKIVPLRKPRKGDYTSAKAWRPISLLSTLGKVLESVVAERISYMVEAFGLLPMNHFGARKKRSAEQALMLLQEYIYKAWRCRQVVSLISFDVKGAYNGVCKERLLQRLDARGIPQELLRWIDAFCSNRTATIVVNGQSSEIRNLPQAGLPQGSPLSPILFLFFNADLVQQHIDKRRVDRIRGRLHGMGHRAIGSIQPRRDPGDYPESSRLGTAEWSHIRGGEDVNHTFYQKGKPGGLHPVHHQRRDGST